MASKAELQYLQSQAERAERNRQQGSLTVRQDQGALDQSQSQQQGGGDFWSTAFGFIDELAAQFGSGWVGAFEGIIDLGANAIGALGEATGWYDPTPYQDFVKRDLAGDASKFVKTYLNGTPWAHIGKLVNGTYFTGDYWENFGKGLADTITLGSLQDDSFYDDIQDKYYSFDNNALSKVKIGDWNAGEFAGGVAHSIGYMLPSALMGNWAGAAANGSTLAAKAASLGAMGLSASGQGAQEALNEGANSSQALGYGLASGAAEVASEIVVGPILEKVGLGTGNIGGLVGKGGSKVFAKKLAQTMFEEGMEEVMTALLEPTFKAIYKGEEAFKDSQGRNVYLSPEFWFGTDGHFNESVAGQFASGAITGGMGEAVRGGAIMRKVGADGYAALATMSDVVEADQKVAKMERSSSFDSESAKYKAALEESAEAVKKYAEAQGKFWKGATLEQKQAFVRYMMQQGALAEDIESDGKSQLQFVEDYMKSVNNVAKSHGAMQAVNLFRELRRQYGVDYSLRFGDKNSIDRKSRTITLDYATLDTAAGAKIIHEYVGHAIGDMLSPEVRNAMYDAIVETSWYEKFESELTQQYQTEDETYQSLSESEKQAYWVDEVVENYLEAMFSGGKNLATQISNIRQVFGNSNILEKLFEAMNKTEKFKGDVLSKEYAKIVKAMAKQLRKINANKPLLVALAKYARGIALTDKEKKLQEKFANLFSMMDEGKPVESYSKLEYDNGEENENDERRAREARETIQRVRDAEEKLSPRSSGLYLPRDSARRLANSYHNQIEAQRAKIGEIRRSGYKALSAYIDAKRFYTLTDLSQIDLNNDSEEPYFVQTAVKTVPMELYDEDMIRADEIATKMNARLLFVLEDGKGYLDGKKSAAISYPKSGYAFVKIDLLKGFNPGQVAMHELFHINYYLNLESYNPIFKQFEELAKKSDAVAKLFNAYNDRYDEVDDYPILEIFCDINGNILQDAKGNIIEVPDELQGIAKQVRDLFDKTVDENDVSYIRGASTNTIRGERLSKINYSGRVDSAGNELTEEQAEFFKDSKIRDAQGNLEVMFHGTERGDRVGYYFDPKRATAGPMAYFTNDEEIATEYSESKNDSSISLPYYVGDWFTINDKPFYQIWRTIPFLERQELKEKMRQIRLDEETDKIILDPNNDEGLGNLKRKMLLEDNALKALADEWLESGYIAGEEERFMEVLRLLGIDKGVDYVKGIGDNRKVYRVYLNVTNPFNTANISEEDIDGIRKAVSAQIGTNSTHSFVGTYQWDKRDMLPETWLKRFNDDIETGGDQVWTLVPDYVTDYLKSKGYDGIIDRGGKGSKYANAKHHKVVIPFYPNQIKQTTNTNPTSANPDIRYSKIDYAKLLDLGNETISELSDATLEELDSIYAEGTFLSREIDNDDLEHSPEVVRAKKNNPLSRYDADLPNYKGDFPLTSAILFGVVYEHSDIANYEDTDSQAYFDFKDMYEKKAPVIQEMLEDMATSLDDYTEEMPLDEFKRAYTTYRFLTSPRWEEFIESGKEAYDNKYGSMDDWASDLETVAETYVSSFDSYVERLSEIFSEEQEAETAPVVEEQAQEETPVEEPKNEVSPIEQQAEESDVVEEQATEAKPIDPEYKIPNDFIKDAANMHNDKVYTFDGAVEAVRSISRAILEAYGLSSDIARVTYSNKAIVATAQALFELFNRKGTTEAEILDGLKDIFSSVNFVFKSGEARNILTEIIGDLSEIPSVRLAIGTALKAYADSGKDSFIRKVEAREAALKEMYRAMKEGLLAKIREIKARVDPSHSFRNLTSKDKPTNIRHHDNYDEQSLVGAMSSFLYEPFGNLTYRGKGNVSSEGLKEGLDKVLQVYSETGAYQGQDQPLFPYDEDLREELQSLRNSLDSLPAPTQSGTRLIYPALNSDQLKRINKILRRIYSINNKVDKVYKERLMPMVKGAGKNIKVQASRNRIVKFLTQNPYVFNAASFYASINARLGNSLFARELTIGMEIADAKRIKFAGDTARELEAKIKELGISKLLPQEIVYNGAKMQYGTLLDLYIGLTSTNFQDFDKNGVVFVNEKGIAQMIVKPGEAEDALVGLKKTLPANLVAYGDWLKNEYYNGKFKAKYLEFKKEQGAHFADIFNDYYPRSAYISAPTEAERVFVSPKVFSHDELRVKHNHPFRVTDATRRVMKYADDLGMAVEVMPKYKENMFVLRRVWGDLGNDPFDIKFREALNTSLNMWVGLDGKGNRKGKGSKILTLFGNYSKALLSFNLGTPLKQTISYLFSNLSMSNAFKGVWNKLFGSEEFKAEFKFLKEHFGQMQYRANGSQYIKLDMSAGYQKLFSVINKFVDIGMKPIEFFDNQTVQAGLASSMAIARDMGYQIGTDAYRSQVAELFAYFVETQIGRNPSNLSRLARGDSPLGEVGQYLSFMQGPMRAALAAMSDKINTWWYARKLTKESVEAKINEANERLSEATAEHEKAQDDLNGLYEDLSNMRENGASDEEINSTLEDIKAAEERVEETQEALYEAQSDVQQAEQDKRIFAKYKAMGGKGWALSTLGGIMAGSILNALIEALTKRLKGKEEWDKWSVQEIVENAALYGSFGWLPLMSTITNAVKGYDTSYPTGAAISMFTDLVKSITSAIQNGFDEKSSKALFRSAMESLSMLTGIPVRNIYNDTYGAVKMFSDEAADAMRSLFYVNYVTNEKIIDAIENGNDGLALKRIKQMASDSAGEISDAVAREFLQLMKDGQSPIASKVPTSYKGADGESVAISWSNQQSIKQFYSRANAIVSKAMQTNAYSKMSSQEKAALIKSIYSAYRQAGIYRLFGEDYGKLSKLAMIAKTGSSNVSVIFAAVQAIKGLKETDKKSKKELAVEYVNKLSVSKPMKMLILSIAGYKVDETQLKSALRSLGMSLSDISDYLS